MPTAVTDLLAIPKYARWPPRRKVKSKFLHRELDIPLDAEADGEFTVFLRLHTRYLEMFSIGLRYATPGQRDVVLIRVNGDHGSHKNPDGTIVSGPHLHMPTVNQDPTELRSKGPATAASLDPRCNNLPAAWSKFRELISLSPQAEVDRLVVRLYLVGSQLSLLNLEDLFDGNA
jgi:hypothetical protein